LLHALLNVPDKQSLLIQPWVGTSWEGYVIEQALGELSACGLRVNAFYFRTSDQSEIDLVLDFGGALWAVEIKLTSSPAPQNMAQLVKGAGLIGASRCVLVSQTAHSSCSQDRMSCHLPAFLEQIRCEAVEHRDAPGKIGGIRSSASAGRR